MLTNMLTQSIMLQKKIVSRLIRVAVKTKNGKQEQRMRDSASEQFLNVTSAP